MAVCLRTSTSTHLGLSCQPSLLCQPGRPVASQHFLGVELCQRVEFSNWSAHMDAVHCEERIFDYRDSFVGLAAPP